LLGGHPLHIERKKGMKLKKSDLNLKNQIFFEKIMIFINPELIRTELHISTKQ